MITLNGTVAPDPVKYDDNHEHFKTDNISLAGNRQRNRRAIKKVATMSWHQLEPAEFQTLVNILESGVVAFTNNASAWGPKPPRSRRRHHSLKLLLLFGRLLMLADSLHHTSLSVTVRSLRYVPPP